MLDASYEIAGEHHNAIACQGGPGTAHVAKTRNKQHIHGKRNGQTEQGKPHSPHRAVRKLVPQRQVEEYAEKEFGEHDDRHYIESAVVAR